MFRLYLVVACLLSSVHSYKTFATVNFTVNCEHSATFHLEVLLIEIDSVAGFDDEISHFGVNVQRTFDGTIGGVDTDDGKWNDFYEFALDVQHDCGGNWKYEQKRPLRGECRVGHIRCEFPREIFNLQVG